MAIGWYLVPYVRRPNRPYPARYCAMDDFTTAILADGGTWSEAEILGNAAIVKVRANTGTLTTIAQRPGFRRIPVARLDESLASLSAQQRSALRQVIEDLGYSSAEIQAALGADLGSRTLGEVLRFLCRRRLKPRYDSGTDTIVCDGAVQSCKQPETVDGEVATVDGEVA